MIHTEHPKQFGQLRPTYNRMGFGGGALDPLSQAFATFAGACRQPVLEIGAGFGIATLEALAKGATIVANDLDERHLEHIRADSPKEACDRLTTIAGSFPDDTQFDDQQFMGILSARVLHFFNGPQLEKAFKECFRILMPGGKLFLLFDTPYKRHWLSFLPEFEQKVARKERWPGYTDKLRDYEGDRVEHLPKCINFMNKEILSDRLQEIGFIIEKAMYIPRPDYPETSQLDGRENVGVIATIPNH